MSHFFWELSVSSVSPDRFASEGEAFMERLGYRRSDQKTYSDVEDYVRGRWAPPWEHHDVVGWIQLWSYREVIKADYLWIDAQRLVRLPRSPRYHWRGKASEVYIPPAANDPQIFALICDEIAKLSRRRPFRGHYIDTSLLNTTGPFIRWRELLNLTYN